MRAPSSTATPPASGEPDEPARLGRDADADQHRVGGDRPSVGEDELLHRRARHRGQRVGDRDAELHAHALGSVQVGEPAAEPRTQHVRERDLGRLDQRDLDAEAAGGCGDLLADEAGADDRQSRPRRERLAQRVRVGERAQRMNVRAPGEHRQPPRAGAGGDDQLVVAELGAVLERDAPGGDVEPRRAAAEQQLDLVARRTTRAAGTARRAAPWRAAGGRRERSAPRRRPGSGRGDHGRAESRPRAERRARRRR